MKMFSCLLIILFATLAVAAEKETAGWQWVEDAKPLAHFGKGHTVDRIVVCSDGTVVVAKRLSQDTAARCQLVAITTAGTNVLETPTANMGAKHLALAPNAPIVFTVAGSQLLTGAVDDKRLVVSQAVREEVTALATSGFAESLSDAGLQAEQSLMLAVALLSHSKTYFPVGNYSPVARIIAGEESSQMDLGGHIQDLAFAPSPKLQDKYLAAAVWDYQGKKPGNYGPYWLCVLGPKAELLARHKMLDAPYKVEISPKNPRIVAVRTSAGLRVVDAKSGKPTHLGPKQACNSLVFLEDGTLVSGGADGLIRLWDVRKTTPITVLGEKGPAITALAAGNSYSTEIIAAVDGRVHRYRRQRPEGEPVPVSGK